MIWKNKTLFNLLQCICLSAMTNDSSRCDTSGLGLIDNENFRYLCAGFGIEEVGTSVRTSIKIVKIQFSNNCVLQGDSDIIFATKQVKRKYL